MKRAEIVFCLKNKAFLNRHGERRFAYCTFCRTHFATDSQSANRRHLRGPLDMRHTEGRRLEHPVQSRISLGALAADPGQRPTALCTQDSIAVTDTFCDTLNSALL
jgi:hypothetical protein